MNFWSFQALLYFLSVCWDLKKNHKHWSYADILQSIVSWPFSFMHCIVIFGHKRSLFTLLLNRPVLFFCLKTWWAVFTSHIKSHETELINKVVDQMHHWSHKTPLVSARTCWDSWNSDSDWTKIVCVGGLREEKLWKRQNEATAKAL